MNNILDAEYFTVRETSTNIQVSLNIDVNKKYTHIAVCSLSVPKTFYVLPSDAELIVDENGVLGTVVFQKGNYDSVTFQSYFAGRMASSGLSWSYGISYQEVPDIGKYTFSVSGNAGIQPSFYTENEYLADMMGITKSEDNLFVGDSLTSPNVLDFQAYDALLLKSNVVANKLGLLQEVYTAGNPYNSNIVWVNPNIELHSKHVALNGSNVYSFSLLDADGNLIELNGSHWSMVLCVFRTDDLSRIIKDKILIDSMEKDLENIDE